MSYITIDDAIKNILSLPPGALLAKIDINNAFRLIQIHPANRHVVATGWKGGIFVDTCLPFGLRSVPKLFNILADLLEWILERQQISFLLHYLDGFLTTGRPGSDECQHNLDMLIQI